jgi:hypothetical protein
MSFLSKSGNTQANTQTKLFGLHVSTSLYGRVIPIVYGRRRISHNVIWSGAWESNPVNSGGKLGGKAGGAGKAGSNQQYDYTCAVLLALCQGPIGGIVNVWNDKDQYQLFRVSHTFLVGTGSGSGGLTYTTPESGFNPSGNSWYLNNGCSRADTITVTVNDYGSPGPTTITEDVQTPMELVVSSTPPITIIENVTPTPDGVTTTFYLSQPVTEIRGIQFFDSNGNEQAAQETFGTGGGNAWTYTVGSNALTQNPVYPATSPMAGTATITYTPGGFSIPPQGGQYTLEVDSAGAHYTFAAGDTGKTMTIDYEVMTSNLSTTGDPLVHLNLVLLPGFQGQQPWNWMVSNFPGPQAIGYSGTAYLGSALFDLGSAGMLPNLGYEVIGFCPVGGSIIDCNAAAVIQDLLSSTLYGPLGWSAADLACGTWVAGATYAVGQEVVDSFYHLQLCVTGGTAQTPGPPAWNDLGGNTTDNTVEWLDLGVATYGLGPASELYTYCAANGLFISPLLDSAQTAASFIRDILDVQNANCFWSEGILKFRSYGDTTTVGNGAIFTPNTQPVYDLDDDDFLCRPGEAPVKVTRPSVRDAYNQVSVEWCNRGNSYNFEPVYEEDACHVGLYGARPASPVSQHMLCEANVAALVARTMVQRKVYIEGADTYQFKLGPQYALLEPMDLVTLTDPYQSLNQHPVRIVSIEEDNALAFTVTAEEFPWGVSAATSHPKQISGSMGPGFYAVPSSVNAPIFLEAIEGMSSVALYTLLMALSGGTNWGGCTIHESTDGVSYNVVGRQTGPSVMGVLTATLPTAADPDVTDTLSVNLTESLGVLDSVTKAQADQFQSLVLIDQELISYETATLVSSNAYNLTYLRRGCLGTPIQSHAIGAPFCLVNLAMFEWEYQNSDVGQTRYFKFTSFNAAGQMEQNVSLVPAYQHYVNGPRLPRPWLPGTQPSLQSSFATNRDNSITASVDVNGYPTINSLSPSVLPPTFSVSVATTGGIIPGGQTLYLAMTSFDAAGLSSDLSPIVPVSIPVGTNTNTITMTITWPTGAVRGDIYYGSAPANVAFLSQPLSSTTSFSMPAPPPVGYYPGPPDYTVSAYAFQAAQIDLAGDYVGTVSAIGTAGGFQTITVIGMDGSIPQWANGLWGPSSGNYYDLDLLARERSAVQNYTGAVATGNTGNVITTSISGSVFAVGDVIAIRCLPSTHTALAVGDSNLAMSTNQYAGKMLFVFRNTGAGQSVLIASNTATVLTFSTALATAMDATSRFVVTEPNWMPQVIAPAAQYTGSPALSGQIIAGALQVSNAVGLAFLVQVFTVNSFGESLAQYSQTLQIYLVGSATRQRSPNLHAMLN